MCSSQTVLALPCFPRHPLGQGRIFSWDSVASTGPGRAFVTVGTGDELPEDTRLALPLPLSGATDPLCPWNLEGMSSEGLPGAGGEALTALGPPSYLTPVPSSSLSGQTLGLDTLKPGGA